MTRIIAWHILKTPDIHQWNYLKQIIWARLTGNRRVMLHAQHLCAAGSIPHVKLQFLTIQLSDFLLKKSKLHGWSNWISEKFCCTRVQKKSWKRVKLAYKKGELIHVYNAHEQAIHFLLAADEDLRLMGEWNLFFWGRGIKEGGAHANKKLH